MKKKIMLLLGCVLFVILSVGSVPSEDSGTKKETKTEETKTTETQSKEEIVYEKVTAKEMLDTLEKNALKAEETYKNKNLEITGQINVIDSDGKYVSIEPVGDDFTLTGIQLTIKNDEQKKVIMELSKGSKVVAKGKVKSVGEVLGYTVDMEEIAPAPSKK